MRNLLLILILASIACVAPASTGMNSRLTGFPITNTPAASPQYQYRAVVLAESLNVRECGSYSCASIGQWKQKGDTVTIYEKKDNWCRIGKGQWVACWWLEAK